MESALDQELLAKKNRPKIILLSVIMYLLLHAPHACSEPISEKDLTSRIGFVAGPYLPAKISGVSEILQVAGLRFGTTTHLGNFEFEGVIGNGHGINFQSLLLNYRMNVASNILPIHALIGLHADSFIKADSTTASGGGWQIGGGAESKIAGPFSLRSDFEYRFGPGTSLLVLVSLMFAF